MLIKFLPYIILSAVHIAACKLNKQKLRKYTKMGLMPLLILAFCLCGGSKILVPIALVFGWIGDIILTNPNEYKYRMAGASSFSIGHVCYLGAILLSFDKMPGIFMGILCILAGVAISYFCFKRFDSVIEKSMHASSLMYFILLGIMLGISVVSGINGVCGIGLIIGYLFFIASDSVLIHQWFTVMDPSPRDDTIVMLTYCIAQATIVTALL